MINPHKYPFQKRLQELKGLPPLYGVISGLQDHALEASGPVLAFPDLSASQSQEANETFAVSWHMPASRHVLEAIHAIAAASQDRWGRTA